MGYNVKPFPNTIIVLQITQAFVIIPQTMQCTNIYVSLDTVRLEHIWVLIAESLKGTLRENHLALQRENSDD